MGSRCGEGSACRKNKRSSAQGNSRCDDRKFSGFLVALMGKFNQIIEIPHRASPSCAQSPQPPSTPMVICNGLFYGFGNLWWVGGTQWDKRPVIHIAQPQGALLERDITQRQNNIPPLSTAACATRNPNVHSFQNSDRAQKVCQLHTPDGHKCRSLFGLKPDRFSSVCSTYAICSSSSCRS